MKNWGDPERPSIAKWRMLASESAFALFCITVMTAIVWGSVVLFA